MSRISHRNADRKKSYMRIQFVCISVAIAVFAAASASNAQRASSPDLKTVAKVDLDRFAGKWYEIGRYKAQFVSKCVGNAAITYTLKPKERIEVRDECLLKNSKIHTTKGEAKVADTTSNAKLKVHFGLSTFDWISATWEDQWIIDLDKDYRYAALGDPDREHLFILSRQARLDDKTYQDILRRAEALGFDPAKVVKTPQGVEVVKGTVIVKQ